MPTTSLMGPMPPAPVPMSTAAPRSPSHAAGAAGASQPPDTPASFMSSPSPSLSPPLSAPASPAVAPSPSMVSSSLAVVPSTEDAAYRGHSQVHSHGRNSLVVGAIRGEAGPSEEAVAEAAFNYRVVCEDGAYVRMGLELSSRHVVTIPYQGVVEVTERCVNNQGLARLRTADGWISEMLNPLSGQRGPIVEQLPLRQPLKFRVTYPGGALVRSGVELSSSVVGTIPEGHTIVVTEKRFSNTPSYRCVPRLKLADGTGWISVRINSPPPEDARVVELLGFAAEGEMGEYTTVLLGPPSHVRARRAPLAVHGAGAVEDSGEEDGDYDDDDSEVEDEQADAMEGGDDQHPQERPVAAAAPQQQQRGRRRRRQEDGSIIPADGANMSASSSGGAGGSARRAMREMYEPHHSVSQKPGRAPGRAHGGRGPRGVTGSRAATQHQQQDFGQQHHHPHEDNEKVVRALAMAEGRAPPAADAHDDSCLVCFSAARTATFVHGETGHISCCLECARVLKGRGDLCPVCRLPIDRVIQHFWA